MKFNKTLENTEDHNG